MLPREVKGLFRTILIGSLRRAEIFGYLQYDHGLIVEQIAAVTKFAHAFEYRVCDLLCRFLMVRRYDLLDPRATKSLQRRIRCIADPVAEEDEDITRRDVDIQLFERRIFEGPQRQSRSLHDLCFPAALAVDRPRQSRVRDAQYALRSVPQGIDH